MEYLKHACWLHTQTWIHRYLMSNADGRWNGAEKAQRHRELCQFYVALFRGKEEEDIKSGIDEDYERVHEDTQELTGYLDEQIGFPLKGRPDYDPLALLFFEKFHTMALKSLNIEE